MMRIRLFIYIFLLPIILLFIILEVLSTLDFFPPVLVGFIPLDCFLTPFIEIRPWFPAKFVFDLRKIHGIAAVMAGAVFHVFYHFFACAEKRENLFCYFNVRLLAISADAISFANFPFMNTQINPLPVVRNIY